MKLCDFLGPWPPQQEILLYRDDPRIPSFVGPIGKLKFRECYDLRVYRVEYSMNQILIRVRENGCP